MAGRSTTELTRVGIAGTGAIGSAVARALIKGIDGMTLDCACDIAPSGEFAVPYVGFQDLADRCDLVVECLPPKVVPELAEIVISQNKNLVLISSCALVMFPEIRKMHDLSTSRIFVPSGALTGIDGIKALRELGIKSSKIASTKPPMGFAGAPYVEEMGINLAQIKTRTKIFEGNAHQAAKGFPANVNVAATLGLAGIGPEKTMVEVWADPDAKGNSHEITVIGDYSTITTKVHNAPNPANPKSSMLAAQSIVATLRDFNNALVVFLGWCSEMVVPAKHFYMIRHGETEANAAKIMAGSMDSPLTSLGREQAFAVQKVVERLEVKPRVIIHSHLSRARDTALIINEKLGVQTIEDADYAELHAGDWEGVSYENCRELLVGWEDPPGGEKFTDFTARIQRAKLRALSRAESPPLVVCHGGVFRGFARLYGLKVPGMFKNCHLYEFQPDPANTVFPWKVWHYEYSDNLLKTETDVFHAAVEIA